MADLPKRMKRRTMAEINVVPYVDVTLVLLVIFMITAPLLTQGVQVELPKAAAEPLSSETKEPLVVTVNKQGGYFVNIGDEQERPIDHETLVARRESAKISEEAEQSSDNLKFKVVDPPRVPLAPVAPNRPLLSSAVLVFGVAASFVFALFLSQIKPTFDNHRVVFAATNIPVLGYVSMTWTDGARLRSRIELASYGAVTAALIVAYGFYLAMQLLPGSAH